MDTDKEKRRQQRARTANPHKVDHWFTVLPDDGSVTLTTKHSSTRLLGAYAVKSKRNEPTTTTLLNFLIQARTPRQITTQSDGVLCFLIKTGDQEQYLFVGVKNFISTDGTEKPSVRIKPSLLHLEKMLDNYNQTVTIDRRGIKVIAPNKEMHAFSTNMDGLCEFLITGKWPRGKETAKRPVGPTVSVTVSASDANIEETKRSATPIARSGTTKEQPSKVELDTQVNREINTCARILDTILARLNFTTGMLWWKKPANQADSNWVIQIIETRGGQLSEEVLAGASKKVIQRYRDYWKSLDKLHQRAKEKPITTRDDFNDFIEMK